MITADAIRNLITVVKEKLDSNELMLWWRQLILTSFKKQFLTIEGILGRLDGNLKRVKNRLKHICRWKRPKSKEIEETEDGKGKEGRSRILEKQKRCGSGKRI